MNTLSKHFQRASNFYRIVCIFLKCSTACLLTLPLPLIPLLH